MKIQELNYTPETPNPRVPFDPEQYYSQQCSTFSYTYVEDLNWAERNYLQNNYHAKAIVVVAFIISISAAAFMLFSRVITSALPTDWHAGGAIAVLLTLFFILLACSCSFLLVRNFLWHHPIQKRLNFRAAELKEDAAAEWIERRYRIKFMKPEKAYSTLFTTGNTTLLLRTTEGELVESRLVVGEGYILCNQAGIELPLKTPPELILKIS